MSEKSREGQLTIKAQLNFPYLLEKQILTFQQATLALEFSEREIRETIMGFISLIPTAWEDEEYEKEIKEAKIKQKIDIRPSFCGSIATEKFCEEHNIAPYKYKETFDYYKMLQAIMNLLNRRKMISKINPVQELEGFTFEVKDDEIREKSV